MTEIPAKGLRTQTHAVDFCVVGGGLAGMSAAIAAARHGIRVALMHDRPMPGGNASSEIRMWICGAHGKNNLETGIVEEIQLANRYRNSTGNWSVWDSILYEKVRFEPNITLLLNCSCNAVKMAGARIGAVKGWQFTTQTWQVVKARLFADCSGDSILAPLTGAEIRWGREARDEFKEDIAPPVTDRKTMGMSCLIQARETDRPQHFVPPAWAYRYARDDALPHRGHDFRNSSTNFWWIEVGGEQDAIQDTEQLRDELLKIAFGVWDHIKNQGDHGAQNWALEWLGFLPGKRESRRYVGDHILTQNEVRAGGRFDDLVAYGGWPMDDHHPAGFYHPGKPTTFHPAPSPFGIPYRALYSRNISNLWCAGRNISVTHAAMSSTRVMATCATLGQAVGNAAAIAARDGLTPRGVYEQRIHELQQSLMDDDCYLPGHRREVSELTRNARLDASAGDPEPLRNGRDRPVDDEETSWTAAPGDWVAYTFDQPVRLRRLRLVFDSDLNRQVPAMPCSYPLLQVIHAVPPTLVKGFHIDVVRQDGTWETVFTETCNIQRLRQIPLDAVAHACRCVVDTAWGNDKVRLFAFDASGAAV
ncbi:MAG: FAD-dependent oxidoreductase [Verrucomicrobia bacterium]|nr:FAD-dependent oxidoreductase [Verrucomicrobiota bacterium]MBU1735043.1 FAD-dependent oxidoreductase [Verrucomicrobiota bacterium]MBU1856676.1 FAD-dependent oxidoreductase [Verrucomicrobiota bacterium]